MMDRYNNIVEQIREQVSPLLNSYDVELVDIELKGAVGNQVLRIFVDVEGGITLKLCEQLSREISDLLDIKNIMADKYRLEVSSPGTDRPLKTANDFKRNRGRFVSVTMDGSAPVEGKIQVVDDENVVLETESGEITFPVSSVSLAKLILTI